MAKKILITVIVLAVFQDKFDHKTQYAPGTELQVDEERAGDLVSRGLAKVKEVEPPKEKKENKEAKEKKAAKEAEPVGKAEAKEAAESAAPPAGDNPETKTEDDGKGTEE